MRQLTFYCIGAALLALCPAATARTLTFDTAPFAGTNVLNTPGRQLVGGERFPVIFDSERHLLDGCSAIRAPGRCYEILQFVAGFATSIVPQLFESKSHN